MNNNQNSRYSRQNYQYARQKSLNAPTQKYQPRKTSQNKEKIINAILTITIASTISAGITYNLTNSSIQNNNVLISKTTASKIVDDKIDEYFKTMNLTQDQENAIETVVGCNGREPLVSYNPNNLAKHILEAAQISEFEVRNVIIAAYKIINEPYRDEVIGEALLIAASSQEENSNYIIPKTTEEFLKNNGYEDWTDYNNNERNNLKDQKAIEEYIGGKSK